jgi:putative membrane protein
MNTSATSNFFYRMLCGSMLGISIIAPGVSGSVMAVMMGIYDNLINIISAPFKNFKKNFFYLLPMGIGAVVSIAGFIKILEWFFENYPAPAFSLFIGLIVGSLPAVFTEANKLGFKKKYLIGTICALAFAVTIGLIANSGAQVGVDKTDVIYFSLCGAIAGITGMIPGMSVSLVLMMLGVYRPMLNATAAFDVVTMLPVAICFFTGLILFSRFTKFIFTKFRSVGYFMVFGFMLGSVFSIILRSGLPEDVYSVFSKSATSSDIISIVLSLVMIFTGIVISYIFQRLGKKFNEEEP